METPAFSQKTPEKQHALPLHTEHGDQRRQALIQTAYQLIAEKGVGGLRTRDVAAHVGINTSTLHYYFPTKEQLLQAVAQQLGYAFTTSSSPTLSHEEQTGSPREKMERYFASLAYQLHTTPERFVVMNELFLASERDPHLAQTLAVDTNWQTYIMDILSDGIQQRIFRKDLDVEQTARIIIAFCKGLSLLNGQHAILEKTIMTFKEWFFTMTTEEHFYE